jgi:hypothetical protein
MIQFKGTGSSDGFLKINKNRQVKAAAGFHIFQRLLQFIIKKYNFLAVNAKLTPIACAYPPFSATITHHMWIPQ